LSLLLPCLLLLCLPLLLLLLLPLLAVLGVLVLLAYVSVLQTFANVYK
jgi:hypothetical protein